MSEIEERRLFNTYQRYGIKLVRGKGARVWDTLGKEYVDFMAGFGVGILGHGHPDVVKAIEDQLESIFICHGSIYNESRERFLEELFRVVPSHLSRAFMSNSGAEANELALKLARKYTGRKGFVAFTGAYHGKTAGALSVTYSQKYREGFEPLLGPVKFLKYGDSQALDGVDFNEAAAVIVEPIQGESGIIVPPDDFLPRLQEKAHAAGSLLIVDEVQSGMGRTGKWWAHQNWKIEPDVMTGGKGIGGGVPMGVTVATENVAQVLKVGEHSSTMGGNPLASAAGAATIRAVSGLLGEVEGKGREIMDGISKINSPLVREVRGRGLMIAVDLKVRFKDVLLQAMSNGLIPLYSGLTVIRFLPPYVINSADIRDAVEIFSRSIQEIEKKMSV
ncbi:MAG: aminotransferase class III-fold pyridoxal phosphate-dependent enzyme [Nitrososphaerota archaeon]|jgi:acetylornithine/LysW-gamma-L-lysine aminotransferase|nr:aminotransferase class III-fold pyridoxal phosphate-dependent enzyme [Nitrososphaerota archaeon]MDG6926974.1 aminotransferase class III-fold pyridoxal phosphate-dependent enzyme [Nitrososphaerota archaeon]MDG6930465.1 aminotransferase class III-fold pyridoxal phosphate-dependent enzyme [Nitrososphaerota archaeon]MDG6931506.1 aminotransferase class III-fold pyridoxal phosphate-dependent enzyme [Nitrososphaerota archaeon]MDG6936389.1 aminotransferase class III-fold pyridoxal phosphate-dependen